MTPPGEGRGLGLALIGYRGTGKSTVGREVAEALGAPFVDADARLESRDGRRISRIFAEAGEPHFRDLEERTLLEIVDGPAAVLATGGGVILRETNRQALARFGWVVWLQALPETLADRLRQNADALGSRPALTNSGTLDEIADVLAIRTPLYSSLADLSVVTDGKGPAEVAQDVLAALAKAEERALERSEREPSSC
jgi:shikimate kinase